MPAAFISSTSFWVVKPWKSQYGKAGGRHLRCPTAVTLPLPSRLVSFCAYSTCSAQVAGGLFGSSPASLNSLLVPVQHDGGALERDAPGLAAGLAVVHEGGEEALEPAPVLRAVARSSKGTIASSSIRVNMSVESSTDIGGGVAALERGERLDDVSW